MSTTTAETHTYSCAGWRDVIIEADPHAATEAAETFARRMARAEYGSRGQVGAVNIGGCEPGGGLYEVSAYIGARCGRNAIAGRNIHFTVRRTPTEAN